MGPRERWFGFCGKAFEKAEGPRFCIQLSCVLVRIQIVWIVCNVHLTISRYRLNDSSTENRVTGRTIYTPGITEHYSVISVYPASNQHNTLLNTCVIEITVYGHDWFIKLLRSLLKYLIWILELKIHRLQNIKNVVLLTPNATRIKKVPWGTKKKQLLRVSEGDNYQIL